jgi:hypothetical protein
MHVIGAFLVSHAPSVCKEIDFEKYISLWHNNPFRVQALAQFLLIALAPIFNVAGITGTR